MTSSSLLQPRELMVRVPADAKLATLPGLTRGRVYECFPDPRYPEFGGWIFDDRYQAITIAFTNCAYLGGGDWEIVGENAENQAAVYHMVKS